MEYTIILAINDRELIEHVNHSIKEGWIPLGGAFMDSEGFCQTMTRTHKPDPVSKKSSLQPIEVVNLWNEFAEMFKLKAKIKVIASLETTIRTRINEKDGFPTLEDWESYFKAISRSKFLRGVNDRNWKASLEWAVRPKSIAGVIEGKYHS